MTEKQLIILNHALSFLISNWDESNEESFDGDVTLADVRMLHSEILHLQLGYQP
jgi:hypothetical protein